jgi:hypothetical protein
MPDNPSPELPTTRVSGSGSARLIALAVAGMLVAVVGFTVLSRPSPGPPSPTTPAVAVVATPEPAPTPSATPVGGIGDFTLHYIAPPPPRFFQYVATATIVGGRVPVILKAIGPDDFRGTVILESAQSGTALPIEVGREWRELGVETFEPFTSASLDLNQLLKSHGRQVTLLVDYVGPGGTVYTAGDSVAVPGPLPGGYTLTILGKRLGTQLHLSFELVVPVTH